MLRPRGILLLQRPHHRMAHSRTGRAHTRLAQQMDQTVQRPMVRTTCPHQHPGWQPKRMRLSAQPSGAASPPLVPRGHWSWQDCGICSRRYCSITYVFQKMSRCLRPLIRNRCNCWVRRHKPYSPASIHPRHPPTAERGAHHPTSSPLLRGQGHGPFHHASVCPCGSHNGRDKSLQRALPTIPAPTNRLAHGRKTGPCQHRQHSPCQSGPRLPRPGTIPPVGAEQDGRQPLC